MASTSRISANRCINNQCTRSAIYVSRAGWKCLDQEVPLCNQCFVAYMKKQFCDIYHSDSTSWSFCKSCNKKIHIPCLVSKKWYTTLEDGAIMCNGCAAPDTALVASSEVTTPTPLASVPQTLVEHNQMIDIEQLHESNGSTSTTKARALVPVAPNEKLDHPSKSKKHEGYRYTPRMTAEELGKIFKGSSAEVIPLFEKILTASDMGRTGRLVLPKRCAEEFFPTIDDTQGYPIEIQDAEGKVWKFNLRTWPNNKSRMYVLEGFEPYGKSMGLSEGDTVTFCRLVPEGKLVIGNRKAPSPPSQAGEVTTTISKELSKRKRISTTKNPNVVRSEQSGIVIVEGGVGSKRKTCETGLRGKGTNKKNKRLSIEDSPRGSNVLSDAVEKGFERRRYKPASKSKTKKTTTGNSKIVISSTEPTVENTEPGPSEPVETEVTEMEDVVTLPVSLNWIKKGPRHRSKCQRATPVGLRLGDEGSSKTTHDHPSAHKGSPKALQVEPESSDALQLEPESSNRNGQTTASSNSGGNVNINNMPGSDARVLPFDLNLQPEPDEEFIYQ